MIKNSELVKHLKYDENFIKKLRGMVDDEMISIDNTLKNASNIFLNLNINLSSNNQQDNNLNNILSKFTNMKLTNKVINEFNKSLIDEKKEINIIEYGKIINKLTNNIDISFLEEFINLIDNDDFCIVLKKIYDQKIFKNICRKDKHGNDIGFDSSNFYKDILKNYKKNVDFCAQEKSCAQKNMKGLHKIITYMLTSECFKLILMRNRNTKKYANYYLFLEKLVKYYSSYQKMKLEKEKRETD